jgi:hypothetical protein
LIGLVRPPDDSPSAGRHTFVVSRLTQAGVNTLSTYAVGMPTVGVPVAVVPAPLAKFVFAAPASVTAGRPFSYTITAEDQFGNVETGYAGTVHFAASAADAQAVLPADYTFTPADGGARSFFFTLKTAGTQSLAVADTGNPAFSGQSSVAVVPSMPTTWVVTGLSAGSTAGAAVTFTLTAMDPYGNVATNYTGLFHFSSSDAQAALPFDYFFTEADAGRHTLTATLKTAGAQTLTFSDTVITVLTATETLAVSPAAAASVQVAGFPAATTAGVAQAFTVTLRDAFGNVATGYTGTVAFSSSDPIAALPASYTFTAADAGVHTFTAALKRAGTQSITVTDTAAPALSGSESGIVVGAAAVSQFAISGPASVTKGVGFKITVTAEDAFGNVNAGYRGAVHLASTDPTGGTQNFTFSNNDNGVHVFSYTFNALGFQTITVTDTTNSSIFGSIVVNVLAQSAGGGGGGGP